ncbi:YbjQ family protein [Massilia sp. PAMC28688]|uniref:YbjQ family protein n=1 Tax=Massilia sp. PAMC28688 TaxID=2861283 RepID=UPI001C6315A6|nr:heavy metal-binding domain-containing protein [Massilia sp. PAMC28688]QYF93590.1 YbjQ family protein [Massilia sp. PAMC28688]
MIEFILGLAFWVIPILLGYIFGRRAEAAHFKSIREREARWLQLPTTSAKKPMLSGREVASARLVTGSMVVSIDYFKRALGALRAIIGGPVQSYETLLDRARREAVLRLKESCKGAHEVVNLRLETSSISGKAPGTVACVEVVAYGTAIYYA